MKTKLPEKITNVDEAKAFLASLHSNSEIYDPYESANDIVVNLFTKDEADKLNVLMAQVCQVADFDVNGYILDLQYDTVITHGNLFCTGRNFGSGGMFRWSANESEAWRLTKEDVEWFLKEKKACKWPYDLDSAEKK